LRQTRLNATAAALFHAAAVARISVSFFSNANGLLGDLWNFDLHAAGVAAAELTAIENHDTDDDEHHNDAAKDECKKAIATTVCHHTLLLPWAGNARVKIEFHRVPAAP
jgi:hypothetical protein